MSAAAPTGAIQSIRTPIPPGAPTRFRLAVVLLIAMAAYAITIVNRTSLSAVGVETAIRFHADASVLALFAVLQLAVYGALQIPIGLLLDRFGPRPMLVVGMVLMAGSQLALAFAPNAGLAIFARVFVGAGDATIFPSLLRVIAARFSPRSGPMAVQSVSLVGGFGQIVSVVPFAGLVAAAGWTPAFVVLASTTVFMAAVCWIAVREARPEPAHADERVSLLRSIRWAWHRPGTRLAFWTHFGGLAAANAFAVLWGYPFLTEAEHLPAVSAAALFSLFVVVSAVAGPTIGFISGRLPAHRARFAFCLIMLQAVLWLAVVAWPGVAPTWLLVLLAVGVGTGAPTSMIAFDVARSHNPPRWLSTATGIVNGGGFFSSVLVILAIGLALDLQGAGTPATYTQGAFKIAFLTPIPLWAITGWAILREGARAHRIRELEGTFTSPLQTID